MLVRRMRQIGLDRIYYGSDGPQLGGEPPRVVWKHFRRNMPLTEDELKIITGNVAPFANAKDGATAATGVIGRKYWSSIERPPRDAHLFTRATSLLLPYSVRSPSPTSVNGSMRAPCARIAQCRCGPVTRPVAPTSPTTSPLSTMSPLFTSSRDRCA